MPSLGYPWYDCVPPDASLLQGDLIEACPIIVPPRDVPRGSEPAAAELVSYNVVVMTQSCDLAQRKIELVLLCPYWPLEHMERRSPFFRSREGKEQLRRGNCPGYHLLNRCTIDRFDSSYLVVGFRSAYSVHLQVLEAIARTQGERLRLLPPYREHLSQAFARFFMRVGLPVDIPPFP